MLVDWQTVLSTLCTYIIEFQGQEKKIFHLSHKSPEEQHTASSDFPAVYSVPNQVFNGCDCDCKAQRTIWFVCMGGYLAYRNYFLLATHFSTLNSLLFFKHWNYVYHLGTKTQVQQCWGTIKMRPMEESKCCLTWAEEQILNQWLLLIQLQAVICSVVLCSFVISWMSCQSQSSHGRPAAPGKVPHCSKISKFVDDGSHHSQWLSFLVDSLDCSKSCF